MKRKALKSTWFNRLVTAPVILSFWIVFYPLSVLFVSVVGGLLLAMKEYLVGVYWTIQEESVSYFATIKDGVRFITGRIKNK